PLPAHRLARGEREQRTQALAGRERGVTDRLAELAGCGARIERAREAALEGFEPCRVRGGRGRRALRGARGALRCVRRGLGGVRGGLGWAGGVLWRACAAVASRRPALAPDDVRAAAAPRPAATRRAVAGAVAAGARGLPAPPPRARLGSSGARAQNGSSS